MAQPAATTLAEVSRWVTSRQMKIEVMAKAAMGSGMARALPTSTPTTLEAAQELWEKRFTSSARSAVQPPSSKRRMDTPKLSSVTVAANRKASHRGAPAHQGASEAE